MEEEIDLRPYIAAVARNWIWIIGAAILAALVALGISFLTPPTYEATALVAVTEPRQVVQFDPRIRTTEENQPIDAYPELATSDELLGLLLDNVKPVAPEIASLSSLRGLLSARAGADPSLINLSATYGDPEVAAEIVNMWAAIFVAKANEVFGSQSSDQQGFFEDQLVVASDDMQQAEQELIDFQARNRSMILENELTALQQTQADQLAKQRQIALLLQDVETLQEQLATNREGNSSASADQLAAILLQLRAFGGVPNMEATNPWQLQVNIDQISAAEFQDQITYLSSLQETLEAQEERINNLLSELEPRILEVQQDKEEADAEEARLTRNLTVAEESYIAVARKVEEGKITSQDTSSGIRLASRSAVPEFSSGPRKLLIIAGALAFGALLAVIVIVAIQWLQNITGSKDVR